MAIDIYLRQGVIGVMVIILTLSAADDKKHPLTTVVIERISEKVYTSTARKKQFFAPIS